MFSSCRVVAARAYSLAVEAAGRVFYGWARSRLRGRGLDYVDFRDYYPGDDIRDVDWRLSARLVTVEGEPRLVVKVYEEEKETKVLVVVDSWAGMVFWDKLGTVFFAVAFLAEEARVFSDTLYYVVPFGAGWRLFLHRGRRSVPREVEEAICSTPERRPGLGEVVLLAAQLRPSVVVLVTDYARSVEELGVFARKVSAMGVGQAFVVVTALAEIGLVRPPEASIWFDGVVGEVFASTSEFYRAVDVHRRLVRGVSRRYAVFAEVLAEEPVAGKASSLLRAYIAARTRSRGYWFV